MQTLTVNPSTQPPTARLAMVLIGTVLLLGPGVILGYLWHVGELDLKLFSKEGGTIEIAHDVMTAVAAALFFQAWRTGKGAVRVAGGALAMLAFAAFVREIDVKLLSRHSGLSWFAWMGEHGLQEVLLILMTLPIFFYLYVHRARFVDLVKLALRWQSWPLYVSGFLVLLCVYLDSEVVTDARMRFWEELLETYSYVFMVWAAWRHLQIVGDPFWDRESLDA
jgi:hypothetical protein